MTEDEEWREIDDFPGYLVSESGEVRSLYYQGCLRSRLNNRGMPQVGLFRDGKQHTRAISQLVAQAFVGGRDQRFDSVIHMDGDRQNTHYMNLQWRPRWFSIKYHKQFEHGIKTIKEPIRNVNTGEEYEDGVMACLQYGLLGMDLTLSIFNQTRVFPTFHRYEVIN